MNCKPGDLAVLIRALCPENVGRIVRVEGPLEMCADGPAWVTVSDRPHPTVWENGRPAWQDTRAWTPDAWLRPIRDPGDDAKDETLSWLPVPTKEGMPA